MSRILLAMLLVFVPVAHAQYAAPMPTPATAAAAPPPFAAPRPTPEELAFARLPADIQQMLAGMNAAQAMQVVQQTEQQAIALGIPRPSPDQFRNTLRALLNSPNSTYVSASAGQTTFPPLSPLVPPPPPPMLLR